VSIVNQDNRCQRVALVDITTTDPFKRRFRSYNTFIACPSPRRLHSRGLPPAPVQLRTAVQLLEPLRIIYRGMQVENAGSINKATGGTLLMVLPTCGLLFSFGPRAGTSGIVRDG